MDDAVGILPAKDNYIDGVKEKLHAKQRYTRRDYAVPS
jgi:hypothetical protein